MYKRMFCNRHKRQHGETQQRAKSVSVAVFDDNKRGHDSDDSQPAARKHRRRAAAAASQSSKGHGGHLDRRHNGALHKRMYPH